MKQRLFFILALYTTLALAQQEASVWYFGENAGLKFNPDGSTTALTDGQLVTEEGCATLSDTNGELLFYTNGVTVWNKNHQVMANGTGLMGDDSTSQSATIVQKPGSSNLFFVFTLDAETGINGFRYSEIDITLDGGLGAVTANKNVLIYTPSCEKISVVKHANGTDYWVVTHGWGNNTFYSYLLSSSGMSAIPTTSNSGTIVNKSTKVNSMGCMKISPDGTKLALCHQFLDIVELFDFSTSTGFISNNQVIFNDKNQVYGIEFSPNSKVLYVSVNLSKKIYQFDLNALNIASSFVLIDTLLKYVGALQLGPNNKIYIANYKVPYLGVINNPDVVGLGCDMQEDTIDLLTKNSLFGLPSFNQSFFNPTFTTNNLCLGASTKFTLSTTVNSATWDFGDGNTSTDVSPTHQYQAAGKYVVTVNATTPSGKSTKSKEIIISPTPILANAVGNQSVCGTAGMNYDLSQHNATLLGSQSTSIFGVAYFLSQDDANKHTNLLPITYTLPLGTTTLFAKVYNLLNTSCSVTASITIALNKQPIANALTDYVICENVPYDNKEQFDLATKNSPLLNGQSASDFALSYHALQADADTNTKPLPLLYTNTLPQEMVYARIANKTNAACFATTTLNIKVVQKPTISTVSDFIVCDDATNDGIASFDVTQKTTEILQGQPASVFAVKYYYTQQNAQDESNAITSVITNTTNNQDIYYTISAIGNSNCKVISSFKLVVAGLPKANTANDIFMCDDSSNDGIGTFTLQNNTATILGTQNPNDYTVSFYKDLNDANTNTNSLVTPYQNISNPQTIFARVENNQNSSCFTTTSFQIGLYKMPTANTVQNIITCDDDSNDGKEIFDLETQNTIVLGTQPTTDFTVTYHQSLTAATAGTNPVPSSYTNTSNPQTIYARITNTLSAACYATTSFDLIVKEKPKLNMSDVYSICQGKSITITAPTGFSSYAWSNDDKTAKTTIKEAGTYSLKVIQDYTAITCETTKGITVFNSNIATITKIETQDWSATENSITVYATGDGDYEYSIDGMNYQDSPQFSGLTNGEHKVSVRDKKGCGIKTDEVFLLMYPKFFTPNGDGVNDRWRIEFSNLEPKMKLTIYDRYGKIINSFNGLSAGWDGTISGKVLPSADYWFVVQRESGKEYKGHFALKR